MTWLSEARRMELLAYCKLTELAEDPEVETLLPLLYAAAVGYMTQTGISKPEEGTSRRSQYDLCINHLVLDSWDHREITASSTVGDNPVFRRMLNQLKMTETVSRSDISGG